MKILLAEDDINISTIAKMTLESLGGHTVVTVDNGIAALESALSGDYDVILLDVMMPGMNGVDVCKAYKSQSDNPVPIIFLSAKSQTDEVEELLENGLGFIPKPFDPTQLCKQIDELLKGAA